LCGTAGNGLAAIDSVVTSWQDEQSLISETTASVDTNAASENEECSLTAGGGSWPGVAAIVEGR
jgi:hypothetical protein